MPSRLSKKKVESVGNHQLVNVWHKFVDFIPYQRTLRTIFIPLIDWERWKRSTWKLKTRLIVFYFLCVGGGLYLFVYGWWNSRLNRRLQKINSPMTPTEEYTEDYDVCIVGAGPSGATCAYYLAKAGKRVLLLDKEQFPRDKCCAGIVTPGALDHLKQMGVLASILDANNPSGYWTNSGGFVSPSGESFVGSYVDYAPRRAIAIQRYILDHKIAQAASKEGATVIDNCKVTRAKITNGIWKISCVQDQEDNVVFSAKVLVAADGAKSKLCRQLGIVKTDPDCLGSLIWANTKQSESSNLAADLIVFYRTLLFPFYGYFAMIKHVNSLVSLTCFIKKNVSNHELIKLNMELINNDTLISKLLGTNVSFSPLKSCPVRTIDIGKPYSDNFLCIGDAAGQCDPLTGVGIQHGMDAAKIAAETLMEGFTIGDLSSKFLQKYHKRWRRKTALNFLTARQITFLVYNFPMLLDAACLAIRKTGADSLKAWAMVMTGEKSAAYFYKPSVVLAIAYHLLLRLLSKLKPS